MLNTTISFINAFLNWVVSLLPVPRIVKPPVEESVWFLHKDFYVFRGYWDGQTFRGPYISSSRRSKYDPEEVYLWGFSSLLHIPQLSKKGATISHSRVHIITDRRSKELYDYVDKNGKKMKVTWNQKKNLEKNPYYTSVSDKRDLINKQVYKRAEQENEQFHKETGKWLYR